MKYSSLFESTTALLLGMPFALACRGVWSDSTGLHSHQQWVFLVFLFIAAGHARGGRVLKNGEIDFPGAEAQEYRVFPSAGFIFTLFSFFVAFAVVRAGVSRMCWLPAVVLLVLWRSSAFPSRRAEVHAEPPPRSEPGLPGLALLFVSCFPPPLAIQHGLLRLMLEASKRLAMTFSFPWWGSLGIEGSHLKWGDHALRVQEVCSGYDGFLALLSFSALVAVQFRLRTQATLLVCGLSLPLAAMANGLRLSTVIWATPLGGTEKAAAMFHTPLGAVPFVLAAVALLKVGDHLYRVQTIETRNDPGNAGPEKARSRGEGPPESKSSEDSTPGAPRGMGSHGLFWFGGFLMLTAAALPSLCFHSPPARNIGSATEIPSGALPGAAWKITSPGCLSISLSPGGATVEVTVFVSRSTDLSGSYPLQWHWPGRGFEEPAVPLPPMHRNGNTSRWSLKRDEIHDTAGQSDRAVQRCLAYTYISSGVGFHTYSAGAWPWMLKDSLMLKKPACIVAKVLVAADQGRRTADEAMANLLSGIVPTLVAEGTKLLEPLPDQTVR